LYPRFCRAALTCLAALLVFLAEIAPRDELAPDMIYAGGDLLGGHINVLE
jgi:hypothetical protein